MRKRADVLERVMVEVERMRRIIQELVTFSRPHSLRLERVDVNQTFADRAIPAAAKQARRNPPAMHRFPAFYRRGRA